MLTADPPPVPRSDAGYTLVEVLAVVVLALVTLGFYLKGPPPEPHRLVDDAARRVETGARRALAEADARGGEALLYADVRAGGRFLALSGAVGVDTVAGVPAAWVPLEHGVAWSVGAASVDVDGHPLGRVRIPAAVRCADRRCQVGEGDRVTYYLSHELAPRAVAAVTVSRDGLVRLYRYEAAAQRWRGAEP